MIKPIIEYRCNHKSQAATFKGNNTSKHQDLISIITIIQSEASNSIENNTNREHSSNNRALLAEFILIILLS